MGVNARLFGSALSNAMYCNIQWGASNKIKVALMKNSWTPIEDDAQDTVSQWDQISSHEISSGGGTNYDAGGKLIIYPSPYYSYASSPTPGGVMSFLANQVIWTNLTTVFDIRYAVVYMCDGTGAAQALIGYVTFAANISVVADDFAISWTNNTVFSVALDTLNPVLYGRMWGSALLKMFTGEVTWGGTVYVALMQPDTSPPTGVGFTPNQDGAGAQDYWNDILAFEIHHTTNYAKQALTGMNYNYIPLTDYGGRCDFVANNVTFSNLTSTSGETFQWAVIYMHNADANVAALLGYVKLAEDAQSVTNMNVTIVWNSGVVFQVSLDTTLDV